MTSTATTPSESGQGVGDRFRPTDQELVNYFLRHKILGNDHLVRRIPEVEFYEFEPDALPHILGENANDQESYFFSRRSKKYPKSDRANRTTKAGHWKSTGRDRKIKNEFDKLMGTKKSLVYIPRSPSSGSFKWIMHEYNATLNLAGERDYALCKVMKRPCKMAKMTDKKAKIPKGNEGEPSVDIASDCGEQYPKEQTNFSTNNEGELSWGIVSFTENMQSEEIIDDSGCGKSEVNSFDYTPNQNTDNSTYGEGEPSHCVTAASENHVSDVIIPEKLHDLGPISCDPGLFSAYNKQDYGFNAALGTVTPAKQAFPYNGVSTSKSCLDEDMFDGLEPLAPWVATLLNKVA